MQPVKKQKILAKIFMNHGSTPMWFMTSTKAEKKMIDGSTPIAKFPPIDRNDTSFTTVTSDLTPWASVMVTFTMVGSMPASACCFPYWS